MSVLRNKVVVITGASSGIGEGVALAFAREGSTVILAARRREKLNRLKEKVLALGGSCFAVETDVRLLEDVKRLFLFVEKECGRVDILVNNAGIGRNFFLMDTSLEDWIETIDTNLTGVFYCTQEAVRLMLKKNVSGHIITVSSVLGLIALPGRSAYCASKHAVTGFKRALRWELKSKDIRISLVHPAGVDTEILGALGVERKKWK